MDVCIQRCKEENTDFQPRNMHTQCPTTRTLPDPPPPAPNLPKTKKKQNMMQPDWWEARESGRYAASSDKADSTAPPTSSASAAASQQGAPPLSSRSVAEVVVEGSWVSPYILSEKKPPPRYEHAVALVNSQIFVSGGNCGGRYLNDTWALNLEVRRGQWA
jgi:hypothetical protein